VEHFAPSGSHGRSGPRPDSLEVNEQALAAKQRFLRALDAVGPELSGILVDVCCLWRGLEAAERSLGWPQRSGKLVLQIALTRLARHYGLIRSEPPSKRPASSGTGARMATARKSASCPAMGIRRERAPQGRPRRRPGCA
jgi:hypothetical protein